jgi:carboxylesterase type B
MVCIFGGDLYSGSSVNPTRTAQTSHLAVMLYVNPPTSDWKTWDSLSNDRIHNGNYGHYDIITALKCISKNVHAFSVDPPRVSIFGETGG